MLKMQMKVQKFGKDHLKLLFKIVEVNLLEIGKLMDLSKKTVAIFLRVVLLFYFEIVITSEIGNIYSFI